MALAGKYRASASTPMGLKVFFLEFIESGEYWKGTIELDGSTSDLWNLSVSGDTFTAASNVPTPMGNIDISFNCSVSGDTLTGTANTSFMPLQISGERI